MLVHCYLFRPFSLLILFIPFPKSLDPNYYDAFLYRRIKEIA